MSRAAMELALQALEQVQREHMHPDSYREVTDALRAALAEPQPEDQTEAFAKTMGGQFAIEIASIWATYPDYSIRQTLDELNRRFPAPKPESVATLHDDGYFTWKRDEFRLKYDRQRAGWRMDVYAAPPQRQPLTDRQIEEILGFANENDSVAAKHYFNIIRAIERAHGIGT